jgi:hypothetical protein
MTDMTAIERLKASKKFGKALVKEKRKQTKIANCRDAVDWRGQHGAVIDELTDDEQPAPVQRVQAPIERLWVRRTIDDVQYLAGKRLYEAYALGVCGARNPETKTSGEASLSFGLAGAQLVAIQEYRMAQAGVGKRLWAYLDWICNKDIPIADLAKQLSRNPTELVGVLKIALDVLSDHFQSVDNQTRKEVRRA